MRLTTYTDYTLRVLIFLTLKYQTGEKATIPEMAAAYGVSRNHLMKIVHDLSQGGFIQTNRGRAGGTALARPPESISIGEVVRFAEADFAIVECQVEGVQSDCAVWQACNLKRGFRRALDAFMMELDKMTLVDAVTSTTVASSLLGVSTAGLRAIRVVSAPVVLPKSKRVSRASTPVSRRRGSARQPAR